MPAARLAGQLDRRNPQHVAFIEAVEGCVRVVNGIEREGSDADREFLAEWRRSSGEFAKVVESARWRKLPIRPAKRPQVKGLTATGRRLAVDRLSAAVVPCDICGKREEPEKRRHHIDHDHATGQFRGILCHGCNVGIGFFRDDPALLAAAQRYLTGNLF